MRTINASGGVAHPNSKVNAYLDIRLKCLYTPALNKWFNPET